MVSNQHRVLCEVPVNELAESLIKMGWGCFEQSIVGTRAKSRKLLSAKVSFARIEESMAFAAQKAETGAEGCEESVCMHLHDRGFNWVGSARRDNPLPRERAHVKNPFYL